MKKSKVLLLSLILILLLGISSIFVPVKVMGLDWTDNWTIPESAKNFVDADGRGIRVYINKVYDYVSDGTFSGELHFAILTPFKEYQFDDDERIGPGMGIVGYTTGRNFFDSDLLDMLQEVGWSEAVSIPEEERIYVYFDVERQVFTFEGQGLGYLEYWMERYFEASDDSGGYEQGYQDGFIAGEKSKIAKNNESFYSNIAIWIPAVITIVALASVISIFGIKKKE